MPKLTTEERVDRLEDALVQLAEDTAPSTPGHRAARRPHIIAIRQERDEASK